MRVGYANRGGGGGGDKGWAMKRALTRKKVCCSRLGLRLEMSPVFDFG